MATRDTGSRLATSGARDGAQGGRDLEEHADAQVGVAVPDIRAAAAAEDVAITETSEAPMA